MVEARAESLMAPRDSRRRRSADASPAWKGPRVVKLLSETGGPPPLLCPFWFSLGGQEAANDSEPLEPVRNRRGKRAAR
ncbi:hypothetical protein [Myxococcus stipitatus]|uniref:hypothetical protein n=1 Tax=Myxococcus stipitatus TaxID=83455 RepID=UPI0030D1714A